MVSLTHTTAATGSNNPNKQVSVSVWNENHTLTGAADTLLGFNSSGTATEYGGSDLTTLLGSILSVERTAPVGFTGTIPFSFRVYKTQGARAFTTNIEDIVVNPLTVQTAALVIYVDKVTGDDADPGTNSASPKQTLYSAISKVFLDNPASAMILIKGGYYDYGDNFNGRTLQGNTMTLSIVSWDGMPVYSTTRRTGLTWASAGSGAYSVSLTSTHGNVVVWDNQAPNVHGGMERLSNQASLAAVQANAASFYHDTGANILYVKTADSRSPDSNIWVLDGTPNIELSNPGATYYLENIHALGGDGIWTVNPVYDTANPQYALRGIFKAKNCSGSYANVTDAFKFSGGWDIALQNCDAFCAWSDGFSYAKYVAAQPIARFIEVNCRGYRNGFSGAGANNGTTSHDGAAGVRVNGAYFSNQDRNVHDVGGGDSWLLGCTSQDNQVTGAGHGNFMAGTSGGAGQRMWLDTCTSDGSTYDLIADTNAVIYTYDLVSDGNTSGTITAYTPA